MKVVTADGVVHPIPDGVTTPEQIQNYLRGASAMNSLMSAMQPKQTPDFMNVPTDKYGVEINPTVENNPVYMAGREAAKNPNTGPIKALPTLGGIAGAGFLGEYITPPGGAFVGGTTAELGRQGLVGEKIDPLRALMEGGGQAAAEYTGGKVVKGAAKFAKALMGTALSPAPGLLERFSTKKNPLTAQELADWALQAGHVVDIGGKRAATAVKDALRATKMTRIGAIGGTAGKYTLAKEVIANTEARLGRALTNKEKTALANQVEHEADRILEARSYGVVPKSNPGTPPSKILGPNGEPMFPGKPATPSRYTATEMEQVKQVAAKNARPGYRAAENALAVSADPLLSQEIAAGARKRLGRFRGVRDLNESIRRAMAVEQAIGKSIRKTGQWMPIKLGPLHMGAKLPQKQLSQAGLTLANPEVQAVLNQLPRAPLALWEMLRQRAQADTTGGQ